MVTSARTRTDPKPRRGGAPPSRPFEHNLLRLPLGALLWEEFAKPSLASTEVETIVSFPLARISVVAIGEPALVTSVPCRTLPFGVRKVVTAMPAGGAFETPAADLRLGSHNRHMLVAALSCQLFPSDCSGPVRTAWRLNKKGGPHLVRGAPMGRASGRWRYQLGRASAFAAKRQKRYAGLGSPAKRRAVHHQLKDAYQLTGAGSLVGLNAARNA
jgi:hypothetical protein